MIVVVGALLLMCAEALAGHDKQSEFALAAAATLFAGAALAVGVWLAGQWDKVEMFAKGLDEYKVFASRSLFGVPYDAVT